MNISDIDQELEIKNPFPLGTVAASVWNSEKDRRVLHIRTILLLEGKLEPAGEQDIRYLQDMGGIRGEQAGWPKKWCVCQRCHAEWQATGFPAPKEPGFFKFEKNRLGAWLFPGICLVCDDELHAVKAPPKPREKADSKPGRNPYAD